MKPTLKKINVEDIPGVNRDKSKYGFELMTEPGHCLTYSGLGEREAVRLRSALSDYSRRNKIKAVTRKEGDNVNVYLVELL